MATLRNIHHTPAYDKPWLSGQELFRLNQLLGAAFTSRIICQRLIDQRDESLQVEFGLTTETWQHIASIKVNSLEDLCRVLTQMQTLDHAS